MSHPSPLGRIDLFCLASLARSPRAVGHHPQDAHESLILCHGFQDVIKEVDDVHVDIECCEKVLVGSHLLVGRGDGEGEGWDEAEREGERAGKREGERETCRFLLPPIICCVLYSM